MISKVFDFMTFPRRPIQALVIRKHHPKTLMCEVTRRVVNKTKYGGIIAKRKNYMVHDPHDQCHIGDIVRIKHSISFNYIFEILYFFLLVLILHTKNLAK
jgi:ribosomal protein S17